MARGDTAARQIRLWMLLQESSELSVEQAAERSALEREEVVVVEYRKLSAAKPERYTIEPHSLNMQGSSVHVVLWARERNAARVFLLDRIESVVLTGEKFTSWGRAPSTRGASASRCSTRA